MGNVDDFLSFLLFGSGIGWICAGIYVAKPHLHGIKYKEGTCNITSVETTPDWDDLPSCSCGKGCSEQYPCLTVRGYFWENSTSNATAVFGTFYSDYKALQKKCLYIPDCKKKFSENSELVYKYYVKHVDAPYPFYTNKTYYNLTSYLDFSCWGYENTMFFDHSYTILLVYISLILPGLLFFGAVIASLVCGSDSHREFLGGILILPFIVVGGLIACLWEILSSLFPRSCVQGVERCCDGLGDCVRSCVRCKCLGSKEREPEQDYDIEIRRASVDDTQTRRRRRSLDSITLSNSSSNLSTLSLSAPRRLRRRASVPDDVILTSHSDVPAAPPGPLGVSFAGPPGPITYDVGGSDNLPPPPSYDSVVNSNVPATAAPSYDDVVRKMSH